MQMRAWLPHKDKRSEHFVELFPDDAVPEFADLLAGRQIELRADVFNLFNTANLSGYANNATQSNQIQVGPSGSGIVKRNAGPPRQFQFGARYVF